MTAAYVVLSSSITETSKVIKRCQNTKDFNEGEPSSCETDS